MLLLPSIILVAIGFLLMPSGGRDDSYITYWSAYSLANFGKILNYSGAHVEQSSSLLQVLWLTFVYKLTAIDLVLLAKLSSVFFGITTLAATYFLVRQIDSRAALPAAILTGFSAYFAYWSFTGMETTLATFMSVLLIITYADFLNAPGNRASMIRALAVTLFFVLVRPESQVVLLCMLLGLTGVIIIKEGLPRRQLGCERNLHWRAMLILSGASAAIIIILIAARELYFGSYLPQPAIAKSRGVSYGTIQNGIAYVWDMLIPNGMGILSLFPIFATIAASSFLAWRQLRAKKIDLRITLALLYLIVYFLFVVFSGGDWMEGGRFLVPLLPVVFLIVSVSISKLVNSGPLFILIIAILLLFEARTYLIFAVWNSTSLPAWSQVNLVEEVSNSDFSWLEHHNKVYLRDIPVVHYLKGEVARIHDLKNDKVVIMSGQAGFVLYHISREYYGQIKFLDRHALADDTFTKCDVTKQAGKNYIVLDLTYTFFFENKAAIETNCKVPAPTSFSN